MQNQSLKWDLGVGLCGEEACGWGSCLGDHKTPCNPQVNGKTDNDEENEHRHFCTQHLVALSVDQKSFAEFLPQELIGKRKRCSRRSSVTMTMLLMAQDCLLSSNALLNLILLDTESDF